MTPGFSISIYYLHAEVFINAADYRGYDWHHISIPWRGLVFLLLNSQLLTIIYCCLFFWHSHMAADQNSPVISPVSTWNCALSAHTILVSGCYVACDTISHHPTTWTLAMYWYRINTKDEENKFMIVDFWGLLYGSKKEPFSVKLCVRNTDKRICRHKNSAKISGVEDSNEVDVLCVKLFVLCVKLFV